MPVHRIYLFGNIRNLVILKVKQMKYKKRDRNKDLQETIIVIICLIIFTHADINNFHT